MKHNHILLLAAIFLALPVQAKVYNVTSPSGKLQLSVSTGKTTEWSMSVNGSKVIDASRIALKADDMVFGNDSKVKKVVKGSASEHIVAPLYRQAEFDTKYNSLILKMKGAWALEMRAYDDGVAYRIVTEGKNSRKIENETVEFNFTDTFDMVVPYAKTQKNDKYRTSFESLYDCVKAGDTSIAKGRLAFMPIYVDLGDNGRLLLMESDLWNYPGMFLRTTGKGFEAEFPPYPNNIYVQDGKYLDYLAEVEGTRTFPWRIVAYGESDIDLPVNNMVYQLATPCKLDDVSWIKPGMSSWDWWNAFSLYGVPFKAGINTESYLYDIDFAAKYGIAYVLVDDGWYRNNSIFDPIPEMDIPRICKYAKEKGVKLLLWVTKGVLGLQPEKAFEHYSKMGVSGFKIDFFDSQEAAMVDRINMYAEAAAKYHLVVDYHGIFKPVGLNRTYPNVLNYEGVAGLENLKWCNPERFDMPRNDVILPYLRQAAGQMDYTPGALRNGQKGSFRTNNERPMSQGTRAHQVACYVVFDSPLEMLCDSPSDYLREDETTRFITSIPTTFDSTRILSGKLGESVVSLRVKDGKYYVGGMTNYDARDIAVDFSFLPEGRWNCHIFADGANAEKIGIDYIVADEIVTPSVVKNVHLAPGGGFAMIITKE